MDINNKNNSNNSIDLSSCDPYSDFSQKNARKSQWYSKIASSVIKCPFCDLKEKYIILQTSNVVLTVNLFPYVEGHLMVIPRRHIEKISDFSHEEWQECQELLSRGASLLKKVLSVPDINILYREGTKESGSSLKHLHIHIIPITKDLMVYEDSGFTYKFQDINTSPLEIAERFRKFIKDENLF